MPIRKLPLVNDEIYHVFNRSVAQQPIFKNIREYDRMFDLLNYYLFPENPIRYSKYKNLPLDERKEFLNSLRNKGGVIVEIYAFAIMPNHYHLLLKQKSENGIVKFIGNIQNSYARYQNIKSKRFGALFQSPFKAVLVENDNQFSHLARYIHLNPLTSYVVKNDKTLNTYPWCSFTDYFSDTPRPLINTHLLKSLFKSKEKLKSFTLNQLDYQRKLEQIKHLGIDI